MLVSWLTFSSTLFLRNIGLAFKKLHSFISQKIKLSLPLREPHILQNRSFIKWYYKALKDGLCGLVVTVPDNRFRGLGFDSRCYQIFWEVVGLERGPLSFVSTIEELFTRKDRDFGLENSEYGREDPLRWPRDTLYPQKLALTSPISGSRSVVWFLFCLYLLSCTHEAEWSPFQTQYSENLVGPGIELGPLDL
jgi:hypothetical protein